MTVVRSDNFDQNSGTGSGQEFPGGNTGGEDAGQ